MAITYQDRRLGPAEKIKDSYDKINQNSGEAKIDLKSLQGQIDSISTADSNASIGVYTITDVTNTNDYVGNITGLTLFDDLRLDLEVTNPNTGSATLDIGDGSGAKSIKFINSQGNKVNLQPGVLYGVKQLKYDGVDWILLRSNFIEVLNKEDLPTLAQGETVFTLDTEELFIGSLNYNVLLNNISNVLNISQFGAIANGVDISTILNNVSSKMEDGDTLFIPSGVYSIESDVIFQNLNDIKIIGNGEIKIKGLTSKIFFNNINGLLIDSISFDGNNESTIPVNIRDCKNLIVKNVTTKNIGYELSGRGTEAWYIIGSENITFKDCVFKNIKGAQSVGTARALSFTDGDGVTTPCKNILIDNCIFENIQGPDTFTGVGKDDSDSINISNRGATSWTGDGKANMIVRNSVFIDFGKRCVKAQAKNVQVINCTAYDENTSYPHNRFVELFGDNSCVKDCNVTGVDINRFIQVYNTSDFPIKNININNNNLNAETPGNTVYFIHVGGDTPSLNTYDNISVKNNKCTGTSANGIAHTGLGKKIDISYNFIELVTNNGILTGNTDFATYPSTNVNVNNNVINGSNSGSGISFNPRESVAFDNKVYGFDRGIFSGNNKNKLIGNNLELNGYGIFQTSATDYSIITNNICLNNTIDDMNIAGTNTLVSNNIATDVVNTSTPF